MKDIGVTEKITHPENMPKTITVITNDFLELIILGGAVCDPRCSQIQKDNALIKIKEIATRHHINFVGEIKKEGNI